MATFKLEMKMDNEAFHSFTRGDEAARILRKLADKIDGSFLNEDQEGVLMDINGNRVGFWQVEE